MAGPIRIVSDGQALFVKMALHKNTVPQAHAMSLRHPRMVTLSPTTGNRNESDRGKFL
jgi:hypothetical protein